MVHYYSENQEGPLKPEKINVYLRNISLEIYTASGVFSVKRVDKGTELLVSSVIMEEGWKVLDLGCGYGVVGIVIGKAFPEVEVLMVDVNRRAVQLARMNIESNKLANAEAKFSDVFSKVDETFNTILLNPPQTAGKELCFKMITESKNYLVNGGLLQLVARHNKGGRSLSEKMKEVFGNVKDTAKKSGYRVYVSEKKKIKK